MYAAYQLFFIVCTLGTAVLTWIVKKSESESGAVVKTDTFKAFQKNYLLVYYLAMMGDWLQGPYVYALYSSYGFSQHDIAVLFVAGFGSSMVFGTFVGALADKLGRKKMCTAYCALYVLSCLTKHFNNYWILMFGRLTGGIATSLLFSAFESWMVSEHMSKGFDGDLVGGTFGMAIFGNGARPSRLPSHCGTSSPCAAPAKRGCRSPSISQTTIRMNG
jgi:predicted MFS family arabinose efflux permease